MGVSFLLDFHSHPWQSAWLWGSTRNRPKQLHLSTSYIPIWRKAAQVCSSHWFAWMRLRISFFGDQFVINIHFCVSINPNLSKCNRYAQLSQACNILSCASSSAVLIGCCKYLESFGSWVLQLSNCLFYKKQSKIKIQNGNNWESPLLLLVFWLNWVTLWKDLSWLVFLEKMLWIMKEKCIQRDEILNYNLCHFHCAL